jgi:hypothetical protein
MMILSNDLKNELMMGYLRPLSKEEYFNVISDKYHEDNNENANIILDKCVEYGIELEQVLEYALRRSEV